MQGPAPGVLDDVHNVLHVSKQNQCYQRNFTKGPVRPALNFKEPVTQAAKCLLGTTLTSRRATQQSRLDQICTRTHLSLHKVCAHILPARKDNSVAYLFPTGCRLFQFWDSCTTIGDSAGSYIGQIAYTHHAQPLYRLCCRYILYV